MRIVVSAQHIRDGEFGSFEGCPIALAVRDALPGRYVQIDALNCILDRIDMISLPSEAREFIYDYDHNIEVHELAFELIIR